MDLNFTDAQLALGETVRELFEKEAPTSVVRAAEPLGFDSSLWDKVRDMGLTTISVPAEDGGGGGGFVDLAIVAEQVGRTLAPVPFGEAAAANHLLWSLGRAGSAAASLLSEVVAGDLLATVALHPATFGLAALVPAGAVAGAIVALDGDDLVVIRRPGVGPRTPTEVIANLGSMPLADCRTDGDERIVVASGPRAIEAHRKAVSHWELLTGAALFGLGSRALEFGLAYVMERRAFGVLIGTFQTIQHRLADNVTALDGARLLTYEAAWAQDAEQSNADELAAMAFLFAGDAAFKTAAESLQFHGGYGYTLEYDIQLYFRRAKAWALIAGDPRARYADLAHRIYEEEEG